MFKKWLNKMYIKWIKGECHHICVWCDYRNVCEEEIDFKEE